MVNVGTFEYGRNGNYVFRAMVGQGSFGQVWVARTSNGSPVAIKIFTRMNDAVKEDLQYELENLRKIAKYVKNTRYVY